jgi:hypothetical protein
VTRELAHRSDEGLEVSLLWNETAGELIVTVLDARSGELLDVAAQHENALDVFNHPYAYPALRRFECLKRQARLAA